MFTAPKELGVPVVRAGREPGTAGFRVQRASTQPRCLLKGFQQARYVIACIPFDHGQ